MVDLAQLVERNIVVVVCAGSMPVIHPKKNKFGSLNIKLHICIMKRNYSYLLLSLSYLKSNYG